MLWRLLVFFLSPVCGPSRVFFNFFFLSFLLLFWGKNLTFFPHFPRSFLSLSSTQTQTRNDDRRYIIHTHRHKEREELREHLSPESKSERERG